MAESSALVVARMRSRTSRPVTASAESVRWWELEQAALDHQVAHHARCGVAQVPHRQRQPPPRRPGHEGRHQRRQPVRLGHGRGHRHEHLGADDRRNPPGRRPSPPLTGPRTHPHRVLDQVAVLERRGAHRRQRRPGLLEVAQPTAPVPGRRHPHRERPGSTHATSTRSGSRPVRGITAPFARAQARAGCPARRRAALPVRPCACASRCSSRR